MKKMICLLCALCIACTAMVGYAVETGRDVKYNYKLSFENDRDFTNKYGWASSHPENPNFPEPLKPTASVVSDGRFGNAYQIINPFFYCDTYNGITWRLELQQVISPMPGEEAERLSDYMKEVRSVNYWVKIPYSEAVEQNVAANTRRTRMTLETLVSAPTLENPNATKSVSYRADVRLKNTDEWQYVQIPINCFVSGGNPITTAFDRIQRFRYLDIDAFNDKSFFGELPEKPVLNSDNTVAVPAPSWSDRSKDVPILIDELVFDRSTEEKPACTRPSPGEETNLMNAGLKTIFIKGEEALGFHINEKNEVTIPLSPSISSLRAEDVECIPEITTVLSDLSAVTPVISVQAEQIRNGAACEVVLPERLPGEGTLTIVASDGITCNRYKLRFVYQEGLYVGKASVEGFSESGEVTSNMLKITVPLYNAEEQPCGAVVAATITDAKSGAVKLAFTKRVENITRGQSAEAVLEADSLQPGSADCVLKIFVFDDIAALSLAAEPLVYGGKAQ